MGEHGIGNMNMNIILQERVVLFLFRALCHDSRILFNI